jgi:hypothetical protein
MPSGIVRKYAPDDVAIVVGTQSVTGLHEGTFTEADREVDTATMEVGSDGEVTIIISPNESGKVKITLQQASPLNDYFNTLLQALQQKNMAAAVVPVKINDKNGTTVVNSAKSFVQKPVKVEFADKTVGREWTFICPYLDIEAGGEAGI